MTHRHESDLYSHRYLHRPPGNFCVFCVTRIARADTCRRLVQSIGGRRHSAPCCDACAQDFQNDDDDGAESNA